MQISLNSRVHGETLKAFYSVPLRLNSWPESRSATIFFAVGITTRRFSRFYVLHIHTLVATCRVIIAHARKYACVHRAVCSFLTSFREASAD